MKVAASLHRLLGDEARLRLLRVLARDRFNVTELTGILGIAQSGVSRHLGLLRDAGLVAEEREGGFTYYRLAPAAAHCATDAGSQRAMGDGSTSDSGPRTPDSGRPETETGPRTEDVGRPRSSLWSLLHAQFETAARDPAVRADEARLQEVLRLRKENFEAHRDPAMREGRQLVPGRSWAAWARALGELLPPLRVADLGCGEGYLTIETAAWAGRVFAIDRSEPALRRARQLARRRRVSNIIWKRGDLERVPLPDASVDLALLSQALHHAHDPARALAEAVRILEPGGRVLILDLRTHEEAWVRDRLGDRWLGFGEDDLEAWMKDVGLDEIKVRVGARLKGDPFTVLIASGRRPDAGAEAPALHKRKESRRIRRPDRAATGGGPYGNKKLTRRMAKGGKA